MKTGLFQSTNKLFFILKGNPEYDLFIQFPLLITLIQEDIEC